MRRLLLLLFMAVTIVIVGGCGSIQLQPKEPVMAFCADAQVEYKECTLQCSFSRANQGIASISVTAPPQLKGITYKWLGGEYSVGYNNAEKSMQSCPLPQSSFASAMVNSINKLSEENGYKTKSEKDGNVTYLGECDSGNFQITVDGSTGYITEVKIEDLNLCVTLTNHKAI